MRKKTQFHRERRPHLCCYSGRVMICSTITSRTTAHGPIKHRVGGQNKQRHTNLGAEEREVKFKAAERHDNRARQFSSGFNDESITTAQCAVVGSLVH